MTLWQLSSSCHVIALYHPYCVQTPKLGLNKVLRHISYYLYVFTLLHVYPSFPLFIHCIMMLAPCIEKPSQKENLFSNLPPEIITSIFSFLSSIREIGECMRVCQQWRDNIISLTADQPRSLRLSNYQLYMIHGPLHYSGYLVHSIEVHTSNIRLIDVIENLAQLELPRLKSLCKCESSSYCFAHCYLRLSQPSSLAWQAYLTLWQRLH